MTARPTCADCAHHLGLPRRDSPRAEDYNCKRRRIVVSPAERACEPYYAPREGPPPPLRLFGRESLP